MAAEEPQSATARRMYNARSSVYNDSWHPSFAQWMVDTAALKPGERVLDLACGTGLVSFPAASIVSPMGAIVAVDISDGMLVEATTRLEEEKDRFENLHFFNHDITDLGSLEAAKEGTFDAITCASAFVLLPDPGKVLKEWITYLKPGGRLVVDTTHPGNLPSGMAWEKVYIRLGLTPYHNRLWSQNEDTFKDLLREAGFDMEKTKIIFKPQVGFGQRYHSIADGKNIANREAELEMNRTLSDRGLVEKAKELFIEEWAALADDQGRILELDGVFVAVARKPSILISASKPLLTGSCACGSITWTSSTAPKISNNCHCESCRKISGSPFITFLHLPTADVTFTPPLPSPPAKVFQASPHAERTFCSNCGSTLTFKYLRAPEVLGVAVGIVDEEKSEFSLQGVENKHIWVGSKPAWYIIPEDGLERQIKMTGVEKLLGEED